MKAAVMAQVAISRTYYKLDLDFVEETI